MPWQRLVRTGFVQCIDDFTAWRSGFEANGEAAGRS